MAGHLGGPVGLTLAALLGCSAGEGTPRPPGELRLMTFNIHHGAVAGLDAIAAAIAAEAPDVVALQEVDRGTGRSGGVDQAEALAALVGMTAAYAPALEWDGGEFGVALLTRLRVVDQRAILLDGADEPRVLLVVELDVGGGEPLAIAVTHLGLTADTRLDQARAIRAALAETPAAALLGDLNARADEPAIRELLLGLDDAWPAAGDGPGFTYSAGTPSVRIDYALYDRAALAPVAAHVVDSRASDHRPLVVRAAVAAAAR
jgi:endonuclease/exonuclease/phosphatase family metal-dependent hydrolase